MPRRIAIASVLNTLTLAATANAVPLTVSIEGVKAREGTFYISIQSETEFMKDEGTAGELVSEITPGTFLKTYGVPAGQYAVTIWHHENSNGTFDTTDMGMPLDGWAMSVKALTDPPTFQDVSIEVGGDGSTVELTMTYHR
ncbi:MAG: DUF2141 domain-containing protein [Pseudomonadota bacterium]